MAENRTNAEAAGVPAARTGEPAPEQRTDPPRKRPAKTTASGKQAAARKTSQASGTQAAPVEPVKPRRPAKAAKATTAKATTAKATTAEATTAEATTAKATTAKTTKAAAPAKATTPPRVPEVVPGAWAEAAWVALREPETPPRRLAELAVAELGPRAAAWADWLRETYPDPPSYGIARLAVRQAGRLGTALAAGAATGPVAGPALRLLGMAWVQATVVLRIAAAYGHDPTDPARAEDLIELLDLGHGLAGEPTGLPRRLGLLRLLPIGVEVGRRPGAAALVVLLAAGGHTEQIDRLAYRAIRRYRTDDTNESISSRNSR